jgi:nickel-dependent lactate racemase
VLPAISSSRSISKTFWTRFANSKKHTVSVEHVTPKRIKSSWNPMRKP